MKARPLTVVLLTGLLFISTVGLQAQFTWTGNSPTDGNITDPTNWGGSAPVGSGVENVSFGSTLAQLTILFPTFSLNNIAFTSGHPAYTVGGTGPTPVLTLNGNVSLTSGSMITFANTLNLTLAGGVHNLDILGSTILQVNGSAAGTGSLTVTGNGTLRLAGANTYSGGTTVNAGTLQLAGGSISHSGTDTIIGDANGDIGSLTITSGGSITDNLGQVGRLTGSYGTVTVDGAGSSWNNLNYLYVGAAGNGSLTIGNGGAVTSNSTSIGNNTGGFGSLTVDGTGSTLTNLDTLYVGSQGSGALSITNGGHASDVTGSIGNNAGGSGQAIVDGAGSLWTNTGDLHVGNATFGYLYVSNGGLVTSANGYVATLPAAGAIASIDGTGTAWNLANSLYVGYQGSGVLILNNHGTVNVANGTGTVHLGNSSGSLGQLFIGDEGGPGGILNAATITTGSGSGTVSFQTSTTSASPYYFTKDGSAAGVPVIITGPTMVQIAGGYTVLAGNNTYTGGTYFAGGTVVAASNNALGTGPINFNNTGDTLNVASGVTLTNPLVFGFGGTLAGNGTFGTAVSVGTGVVLSPGNSPGTLSFTSGLTLTSGGTLNFEVQSAAGPAGTGYDLVSVSGAALDITATSGTPFTLKLISLNAGGTAGNVSDFSPASSYSWIVATSVAGITNFAANKFIIDTSAFSNSLGIGSFSLLQGISGGNPALILNFTPVPEPSTYALLVTGLALAGLGYRRQKRSSRRLARP